MALRAFLFLASLAFLALGVWQVQRLFWKLDLIDRVDARVHAQAVPPPGPAEWPMLDAGEIEYRHVIVTGTFDHSRETLVQAVTERGPGFWVLTPFILSEGPSVLINRGFVPPEKRDPATRSEGQIAGRQTVSGLLRLSEPRGAFLRTNDPGKGNWYSRDVQAIGDSKKVADLAPYFIDADAAANPGGLPIGGLTVIQFRNSHLVYALTWFALAAMSIGAGVMVPRLMRRAA
jgi:surfeit locus 1 family protein